MVVRGAPAIGATAAYGIVLALKEVDSLNIEEKKIGLEKKLNQLLDARPTAVDLANFALETFHTAVNVDYSIESTLNKAIQLADNMVEECRRIGIHWCGE